MNIHSIYPLILPYFRRGRLRRFAQQIKPDEKDTLLDVGGYPGNWPRGLCPAKITIVNVDCPGSTRTSEGHFFCKGDGCNLKFPDAHFDIVYSNSAIEHVSTYENQQRFASEMRRVGRKLWVQTPARWFPVEPHLIMMFVHYLPKSWQRRLIPWCSVWGWLDKPTPEEVDEFLAEVRLLTYGEMQQLFPDCRITRERFMGVTKAFVAVRK